jgi:hypothetical protein
MVIPEFARKGSFSAMLTKDTEFFFAQGLGPFFFGFDDLIGVGGS